MIPRAALLLCLFSAQLSASAILDGFAFTRDTGGVTDADTWVVTLSARNFAIQIRSSGTVYGGCYTPYSATLYRCPATIQLAGYLDTMGRTGAGTIAGIDYSTLDFGPDTQIHLAAEPLVVTGEGTFDVPFTMSGHLEALPIVDQDIWGGGIAHVRTQYRFQHLEVSQVVWTFTPEPSSFALLVTAIAAALLSAAYRKARCP